MFRGKNLSCVSKVSAYTRQYKLLGFFESIITYVPFLLYNVLNVKHPTYYSPFFPNGSTS
jgi:hypothetical protein